MNLFCKTRPQVLFESLWSEAFHIVSLIWQITLSIRTDKSSKTKSDLFNFLENKSEQFTATHEQLYEVRKEIVEALYKNYPEPHKNEWYKFVNELTDFQENLMVLEMRLFFFKDVLMQIDETNPKWKELNEAFKINFEKLISTKSLINNLVEETSQATHDAIVIARSIEENISFEEADKIERKRWE